MQKRQNARAEKGIKALHTTGRDVTSPKTTNKMPRLTSAERERAIGMLQFGATTGQVAATFGCSVVTVRSLRQRFNQTGQTSDRPRTGRPRVTTAVEDRHLRTLHLRNRFLTVTASSATALGHPVSRWTVTRRLRAHGIRAYRPYRGMLLTDRHRQLRLRWARQVRRWQLRDWRRVMFSDESRFCLSRPDGRVRVYRRQGERTARCCVQQSEPYGGGSVMVWGGIYGDQNTDLVVLDGNLTAQRYIDEVLQPTVLPFLQQQPQGALFQHDNARPHVARVVQNFLNANNVNVLPWPARSPDMSPIEHLWDHLDRRIRRRQNPPATRRELAQALVEEWGRIPADVIRRLTTSVRRRVHSCIEARGGHTRY